jgi:hypothetical protein
MKSYKKLILVSFMYFFLLCLPSALLSEPLIMEQLDYTLSWMGIEVGKASLQLSHNNDGVKIVSIALSNNWISKFYKVENFIQSTLNSEGYPVRYKLKLHQGKRTRDREVFFDYKSKIIKSIDKEKNKVRTYKMAKKYYDPLSGLYELRQRDITVGTTELISIFDKKRFYEAHVKILRRERIETSYGQFDTIVVHPLLESEGIFTAKADILIWLTDNEKKIPVKIRAKVKVGTVVAYLKGDR